MSLTVGGVVANLGARLDDAAFDRWERRLTQARRSATDDVEAKLGGDYEDRDFRKFDDRLDRTRRAARDNVKVELKADSDERGFTRWTQRLNSARAASRDRVTAKLGADFDDRGFNQYQQAGHGLENVNSRVSAGSRGLGVALGATAGGAGVAAIAVGGLAFAAKKSVDIFEEHEVVARRQDLVIRTMGQDAGATADHVDRLAAATMAKTGIDDDAIVSGANVVRTFRNIRNEVGEGNAVFDRATIASFDLAEAMGSDAQSAAIMLGKALNDPAKGAAALGRTGAIAKGDIESLKKMAEEGAPLIEQQRFILEKVEEQFKGSAEAAATSSKKMTASMGEMAETAGQKVAPAFNSVVDSIRGFADEARTGEGAGGRFAAGARTTGRTVARAYEGVRDTVRTVFAFIDRVIDDNRDTLDTMGRSVRGLASTADRALDGVRGAFASVFSSRSGTSRDVRSFIRAMLDIADAALKVLDAIAKRALPGIVTAFRGFFQTLRGVIRLITGILTGDFGKAWDGVKDIFGGGVKAVTGLLRAGTAPMRAAAAAIGNAIAGAFSSAWKAITGTAEGFVNRVIDVINIIPGVNIKHVGGSKSKITSDGNPRTGAGRPGNFAQGGAFGMTGGFIDEPIAVMGEEAPTHPEWVIPENPAYRGRALELWAAAGEALGAFRKGGRHRARARAFAEGGVVSAFHRARKMMGAGPKPSLALFEAGIVESGLRNLPYGDRDSVGALQQRPSQGWTGLMDPFRAAIEFLQRAIPLANSVGSAGQLAQAVQRSAYPERYDAVRGQAEAFLKGGGGLLGKIGGAIGGLVSRVVETAAQVAKRVVGKLPGNPGGVLKGAYAWALGKAREFIRDKATDVLETVKGAIGLGSSGGKGVRGGTLELARRVAAAAGLRVGSTYRDPSHNAAVGGVPGSLHTHGSPSNPGAVDLNGPPGSLYAGQAAARKLIPNLKENLVHDVGSGLHLHLGFFRRGGRALARLGGAFRTGGALAGRKLKPRPAKPSKPASVNAGVRRSVARGEAGITGFEDTIQDLERDYDQADRRFGLSDEVLLIENEDGSTTVDTAAVQQRLAELEGLRRRREAIKKKIEEYRRAVGKLIRTLTAAIGKLKKALKAAGGKSRAKERAGYREAIQTYTDRIGELRGVHKDLGGDVEDQRIDLAELANEHEAVKSTASTAADPTDTADPAAAYVDTSAAIDPAAQAAEVAAQARAQFEAFQSARADLFRDFGSNNVLVGTNPYATATGQAAGAQYFGAAAGGTVAPDARAFATAGGSVNYIENATFENHYPATPPDGGSHIQQQAREARLAFG